MEEMRHPYGVSMEEKLVIRGSLYSILDTAPLSTGLADQHAFRSTVFTTTAVISLLHTVTSMLET